MSFSVFDLYLFFTLIPNLKDMCDDLVPFCLFIGFCISTVFVIVLMVYGDGDCSERTYNSVKNITFKVLKTFLWVIPIAVILNTVLPNQKQMAMIVGISYVSNIDGASKLPSNVVAVMNDYLEKALEDPEEDK